MSGPSKKTPVDPGAFVFSGPNQTKVERILAKYPEERQASAVLPLLDLAQRQSGGWLPRAAMDHVAEFLSMPPIRVYEVATFYTMFNLKPVGEHFIQICTTTPCWLRGSGDIVRACKETLGIGPGETTEDGKFTVAEAECLGACVNAPMIQIGDDYYEDLDPEGMKKILELLQRGEKPTPGSQTGRRCGAPQSGPKTLLTTASGTTVSEKENV
ncbi:MAG: NADH-quinone oxidoreductase subunit NuoE [Rhodospirillaceae bacterium]|nr:MAG: NADH-quinone oxidoreductase subunit NuoE [Rhodospirillaceae bacterium]